MSMLLMKNLAWECISAMDLAVGFLVPRCEATGALPCLDPGKCWCHVLSGPKQHGDLFALR